MNETARPAFGGGLSRAPLGSAHCLSGVVVTPTSDQAPGERLGDLRDESGKRHAMPSGASAAPKTRYAHDVR